MSSQVAIGIDFGTSTSLIAVYRDGKPWVIPDPVTKLPYIPSIVAVDEAGQLHIGEPARPWVDLTDGKARYGIREVKRRLGTGEPVYLGNERYRPEEIAAYILKRLVQNAEEALGWSIEDVVLSVPANFSDAARNATLEAGRIAGLNIQRLINEPTAAALAYGIKHLDTEAQIVVFDFGGGTLDVTVLEMFGGIIDVKASYGDPGLGGADIDRALERLIYRKFLDEVGTDVTVGPRAKNQLKAEAEKAKIRLSKDYEAVVDMPAFGVLNGAPIPLRVNVTREEFNRAIAPELDKARLCLRKALDAKKIRPSAVEKVLLVGGTSHIPAVRELVAEMFAREPEVSVEPEQAVVMGVAVQAAMLKELIVPAHGLILTDVAPYGLGLEIVDIVGGQPMLVYDPLMPPNTTIPFSTTRRYSLMAEDQDTVELKLYQDHSGTARFPEDAVYTGIQGLITDIPPSQTGVPHSVEVEFSYDANGLAQVRAYLPDTGQSVTIEYAHSALRLSPEARRQAEARLQERWRENPEAARYEPVLKRAEQLMMTVPGYHKNVLEKAVAELKYALSHGNKKQIEEAGGRLVDLIYDITSDMDA